MMEKRDFTDDWDVESYRLEWDSDEQWELRRRFMIAHKKNIPEDRVVCLAQVYANIEFLCCRYPADVMKEVEALAEGLPKEHRERKQKREQVQFVKGKEQSNSAGRKRSAESSYPQPQKYVRSQPRSADFSRSSAASYFNEANTSHSYSANKYQVQSYYTSSYKPDFHRGDSGSGPGVVQGADRRGGHSHPNNFNQGSNRWTDHHTTGKKSNLTEGPTPPPSLQCKFQAVADKLAKSGGARVSVRETLNNCTRALNVSISLDIAAAAVSGMAQQGFVCKLLFDDVRVAVSGLHSKKKDAVNDAYIKANAKLTSGRWRLRTVDGGGMECWTLDVADSPVTDTPGPTAPATSAVMSVHPPKLLKLALRGFVLLERTGETTPSASSILHNSATFCKKNLRFEFSDKRCTVLLEEAVIAEAEGTTKNVAKRAASREALKRLRAMVNTLKMRNVVVPEGDLVSRDGLNVDGNEKVIEEDNVGSKLLRQMGWAGGGLGKFQSGIVEPVKARQTYGREGLGLSDQHGVTVKFVEKVTDIIKDYAVSNSQNDLVFTSDFSSEERAKMHQIAQRFHLKSNSRGSGGDRRLTISRKYSSAQLLDHVCRQGGFTDKYELLPPSHPK